MKNKLKFPDRDFLNRKEKPSENIIIEAMEEFDRLQGIRKELIKFLEWQDEFSFMISIHDTREEIIDKYINKEKG